MGREYIYTPSLNLQQQPLATQELQLWEKKMRRRETRIRQEEVGGKRGGETGEKRGEGDTDEGEEEDGEEEGGVGCSLSHRQLTAII